MIQYQFRLVDRKALNEMKSKKMPRVLSLIYVAFVLYKDVRDKLSQMELTLIKKTCCHL